MRHPRLLMLAAAVPLIAGCLSAGCIFFAGPPAIVVGEALNAEAVVAPADYPTALAFDGAGTVFYAEKNTGRIRVIVNGLLQPQPFAEVPVNFAGDRGLLGLAVHPRFVDNGRLYVFYTLSDSGASTNDPAAVVDNRVVYFEAAGSIAAGGEVFVASLPAGSSSESVGGRLAFAADGTLLVALGDLGVDVGAQDLTAPNGKVLRYNDDGSIPADNPIPDSAVYALGVRDVRALAIDPVSGRPFTTERNPTGQHEVNRILAGRNYGWPFVTGQAKTAAHLAFVADNPDYVDPLIDSQGGRPDYAGGSFNPSGRYGPDSLNEFFFAESSKRHVLRLALNSARTAPAGTQQFAAGFPSAITDVAFTPAGTLYVACENAIFRIVPVP